MDRARAAGVLRMHLGASERATRGTEELRFPLIALARGRLAARQKQVSNVVDRASRTADQKSRDADERGRRRLWNSQLFAGEIMAELPHDGAAHVYLNYPRAGHIVFGIPYGPIDSELLTLGGGTPASNSAAHISDSPAAINFIKSH